MGFLSLGMKMVDKIIDAINDNVITTENINFNLLRSIAGTENDLDIHNSLGYGRNVLNSLAQLDQYLYSYGLMIQSQWSQICENLHLDEGNITLLDYGCGQGLASLLLFDNFEISDDVREVILIEPSDIALNRAEGIIRCCYPGAEIRTICSDFDSVEADDLVTNDDNIRIHLMSNVLDISGFDHFGLIEKLGETRGIHYFIAVSHDRNFEGGASRLEELFNAINECCSSELLESRLERYTCNGKPAIGFVLKLEL